MTVEYRSERRVMRLRSNDTNGGHPPSAARPVTHRTGQDIAVGKVIGSQGRRNNFAFTYAKRHVVNVWFFFFFLFLLSFYFVLLLFVIDCVTEPERTNKINNFLPFFFLFFFFTGQFRSLAHNQGKTKIKK